MDIRNDVYDTMRMHVELDAFSGRPNPGWSDDSPEASKFVSMLRSLHLLAATSPSNVREPPDLGYRGFIIRDRNDEWRVFAGQVEWRDGTRVMRFRDVSGIENQLKAQARARGYGTVLPH
jgi:hypothetical protein